MYKNAPVSQHASLRQRTAIGQERTVGAPRKQSLRCGKADGNSVAPSPLASDACRGLRLTFFAHTVFR